MVLKKLLSLVFSKILLKFAIISKIFEYLCPFLSLTIISGQQNVLGCVADGLHDRTPEKKMVLSFFHCEIWKLSFSHFFLFDLINNKARKLEVAESLSRHGKCS